MIMLQRQTIILDNDTFSILQCYFDALCDSGLITGTLSDKVISFESTPKSHFPNDLLVSEYKMSKGLLNKGLRFVEKASNAHLGGQEVTFPRMEAKIDDKLIKLYEEYVKSWANILLDVSSLEDMTAPVTDVSDVALFHLCKRFIVFVLAEGNINQIDHERYLEAMKSFILRVMEPSTKLFRKNDLPTKTGIYLYTTHGKYFSSFNTILACRRTSQSHNICVDQVKEYVLALKKVVIRQIIAYHEPTISQDALHDDVYLTSLQHIESMAYNSISQNPSQVTLETLPKHDRLQVIIDYFNDNQRNNNYCFAAMITKLCSILQEIENLDEMLEAIRSFIAYTSWMGLLAGIIKLSPLNDYLTTFTNRIRTDLDITVHNLSIQFSGYTALAHHKADELPKINQHLSVSLTFYNLDSEELHQRIKKEICSDLSKIYIIQRKLDITLIESGQMQYLTNFYTQENRNSLPAPKTTSTTTTTSSENTSSALQSTTIQVIAQLFNRYANDKGYNTDLTTDEPLRSATGQMHEARARWIRECLLLLVQPQSEKLILGELAVKLIVLEISPIYEHFTATVGRTEIQKCIEQIKRLLSQRLTDKPGETTSANANPMEPIVIDHQENPNDNTDPIVNQEPLQQEVPQPASVQEIPQQAPASELPTFVTYLSAWIKQLLCEENKEKRPLFIKLIEQTKGTKKQLRQFEQLHAGYLQDLRHYRTQEDLCDDLAIMLEWGGTEEKKEVTGFMEKAHRGENVIHYLNSQQELPADVTPYKKSYIFLATNALFYIDEQGRSHSLGNNYTVPPTQKPLILDNAQMRELVCKGTGNMQDPAVFWVQESRNELKSQKRIIDAHAEKKNPFFNPFTESTKILVKELNNKLTIETLRDQFKADEFLAGIKRHLLPVKKKDEKQRADEYKALDALLIVLMDELQKEIVSKEQQTFCEQTIRYVMALGANPLLWMNQVQQISQENRRGYMLVVEQSQLILSHLEERALSLGDTVFLLKDKWRRLNQALVAFARRLHERSTSEDSRLWNVFSQTFNLNARDGAQSERTTIFLQILEIMYVLLNDSLLAMVAPQKQETQTTQKLSTAITNKQDFFMSAVKMYVCSVLSKPEEDLVIDGDVLEKINSDRAWSIRNLGRKTFVELFEAYSDLQNELMRLAEARQRYVRQYKAKEELERAHAQVNTLNSMLGKQTQRTDNANEQLNNANIKLSEAVKEKEEAVKEKEEAVKGKEEAVKGKEEAVKGKEAAVKGKEQEKQRADEAEIKLHVSMSRMITMFLPGQLGSASFRNIPERRKEFDRRCNALVQDVKQVFSTLSGVAIENELQKQLREKEYAHLSDLVGVSLGGNLYSMYGASSSFASAAQASSASNNNNHRV
ncbi:MAG: hypothetical protein QM652_11240 [Legionella sp.]|uniref:hypothetical protein n=1 Tax=Legionella sp. TaxID=459 RepID=UPI0039E3B6E0